MEKTKLKENHAAIIDSYFANGFNGTKAAMHVNPALSYAAASQVAHLVLNKKENQPYIRTRRDEIAQGNSITPELIAHELKAIATADITELIGLSEAEVKELNPATRRAIRKVSNRVKEYINKDGSRTKEVTTLYEMHDKLKALDYLSKYVGFYEQHNKQRAVNINLNKLDSLTLNNVLNLITEQDTEQTMDPFQPQNK